MIVILFLWIKRFIIAGCIYGIINFLLWYIDYFLCLRLEGEIPYKYKKYDLKNPKQLPRFSFNQFLQFYKLNPDQWEFHNGKEIFDYPARLEINKHQTVNFPSQFWCEYFYYPIFFTDMIENRKYKKWAKKEFKRIKNIENNKAQNEATRKIIGFVNEDIEEAKAEMVKALNETEKTLTDTLTRLNKEQIPYFITDNINGCDKSKF